MARLSSIPNKKKSKSLSSRKSSKNLNRCVVVNDQSRCSSYYNNGSGGPRKNSFQHFLEMEAPNADDAYEDHLYDTDTTYDISSEEDELEYILPRTINDNKNNERLKGRKSRISTERKELFFLLMILFSLAIIYWKRMDQIVATFGDFKNHKDIQRHMGNVVDKMGGLTTTTMNGIGEFTSNAIDGIGEIASNVNSKIGTTVEQITASTAEISSTIFRKDDDDNE